MVQLEVLEQQDPLETPETLVQLVLRATREALDRQDPLASKDSQVTLEVPVLWDQLEALERPVQSVPLE